MKPNHLFRIIVLLTLMASFFPAPGIVKALPASAPPPVDMFQWPWEQGLSWVAFDGFDNGTKRLPTSPHNYQMGGAIDFAPHNNMVIGEDTSNFWVTAAAAGTVTVTSSCYVIIDHGSGWTTEYWHLDKVQVNVGALVSRNQRLGVIADNKNQRVCTGNEFPGPHLHFVMRPKMIETIFSGWKINYNISTNITTFTKNGQTIGRNEPILNVPVSTGTPVVTNTPTSTGTLVPTSTSTTNTPTSTGIPVFTNTPTPIGTLVPTSTSILTNTPVPTSGTPVFTNTPTPTGTLVITSTPTSSGTPITTDTPTPTGTLVPTNTSVPTSTLVPSNTPTATIITEPYVLTSANPLHLAIGDISLITVSLNNIPVDGYTSTEFTCTYIPSLVEVSNIIISGLFGADPVSGILGPQNGSFIVAIAGSNGNKAMVGGTAFTFNVRALQIGQTSVECTARVSNGQNVLQSILSIPTNITIVGFVTPSTVPTAVPTSSTLTGQVLASKLVTIRLYNPDSSIAASTTANPDGTFSLTASGGTYTVVATADGFLSAQGSVTLINGNTSSKPLISLIAGDIDGNSSINQIDALTIGINYNNTTPAAADLNNDGIINVLDLGILAENYGASGALAW